MRKIVREYTTTTYKVLEYKEGQVQDAGELILEGEENLERARKKIAADPKYKGRNVFIGETASETAKYSMAAEEFIKVAEKEV